MSKLPNTGIACWPVGNGDAITLVAPDGLILQFDINHSSSEDNEWAPVVDLMEDELKAVECDGILKPELPVLLLSHHDVDHISGIERAFDEWRINELIITLRCFLEKDELTDLGKLLLTEAERRRDAEITAAARGARAARGDRLQLVGYADVLETKGWQHFPRHLLTVPGNTIGLLDGDDHSESVELFVHSPFRDNTESGDRNDSCLGLHVTMKTGGQSAQKLLLLGDLEHETIEAIFETSIANGNEDRLDWDVLVGPHHGSRHAVRTASGQRWIDAQAARYLDAYHRHGAAVIVSSNGEYTGPGTKGANPPHSDARLVYERIVGRDYLYHTHHEARGKNSSPITVDAQLGSSTLSAAARAALLSGIATSAGTPLRPGDREIGGTDREFA